MSKKGSSALSGVPHVQIKDVKFASVIRDEVATIVAEQGIVFLKVKRNGQAYPLPCGVQLTYEAYGQDATITVRPLTQEVVLEPGPDDVYEANLNDDDSIMAVDDIHEIKDLYNEEKVRLVSKSLPILSTCLSGLLLSVVSYLLLVDGFKFASILYMGIPAGIIISIFAGILPTIKIYRQLNSNIIVDSAGNFIDLDSGRTSINGGMNIPI